VPPTTDLEHAQLMTEERPWAASVLLGASAEIEKNVVFRSLAAELTGKIATRSMTDAAMVILCPGGARAVDEYYGGTGSGLRKLLPESDIRVLDEWLTAEVRRWSERWAALDPSRSGAAGSTREALDDLKAEVDRRVLPNAIARIVSRLKESLHVRPGSTDHAE
jgi:hypothetical protein